MALSIRENICREYRLPEAPDLLLDRAKFLPRSDRDLVKAILLHGQSAAEVARLQDRPQRSVRAKIRRLCNKLASRKFVRTLRAIPMLPEADARIALRRFCHDVSQTELADELGMSVHAMRRRLDRISAQIAVLSRPRKLSALPIRLEADDEN